VQFLYAVTIFTQMQYRIQSKGPWYFLILILLSDICSSLLDNCNFLPHSPTFQTYDAAGCAQSICITTAYSKQQECIHSQQPIQQNRCSTEIYIMSLELQCNIISYSRPIKSTAQNVLVHLPISSQLPRLYHL